MPHRARVGRSASRRTSAFGSNYENCRTLRKAADVCGSGPGWNIDSLTSPPARDRRRVTGDFARISLISDALPPSKTLKPFIGSQPRVLEPLRDEFNLFAALVLCGDVRSEPLRDPHQIRKRPRLHLLHHPSSVELDSDFAHAELRTDLLVEEPLGDQGHHVALPRR